MREASQELFRGSAKNSEDKFPCSTYPHPEATKALGKCRSVRTTVYRGSKKTWHSGGGGSLVTRTTVRSSCFTFRPFHGSLSWSLWSSSSSVSSMAVFSWVVDFICDSTGTPADYGAGFQAFACLFLNRVSEGDAYALSFATSTISMSQLWHCGTIVGSWIICLVFSLCLVATIHVKNQGRHSTRAQVFCDLGSSASEVRDHETSSCEVLAGGSRCARCSSSQKLATDHDTCEFCLP